MDATKNIAIDLFYKIRSRFAGLKLGGEDGAVTINPDDARFFDFNYMDGENAIGHITISLAEENSIKVYFSTGITDNMSPGQKIGWYKFLRELRLFAKRRLMAFDTRDITKSNLDKRDYAFLSRNSVANTKKKNNVGESVMSEGSMYGTKSVSYQKLLDTRLIVKHSQTLADDYSPGARTRNISALFVENQEGERFKYPFIHLSGARAMQRHVANGGVPYDELGSSIVKMSEEIAQLKSFSNYVVRNDLMNGETNELINRSSGQLNHLREMMSKLAKQRYYDTYKADFKSRPTMEMPESVVNDFVNKFTVKNFKEDIKSVFPILYRLTQEDKKELEYDDIIEMTAADQVDEPLENIQVSEFDKFSTWVSQVGEGNAITSTSDEQQLAAAKELQDLVSEHFSAGVDGTNAIESLKGIIDDPQLYRDIRSESTENPDADVRPLVKGWLNENLPALVDDFDFGDMDQAEPDKQKEACTDAEPVQGDTDSPRGDNTPDLKELAEFIHSFYDRDTNTFPKGPEGVSIMVGKRFGERAEHVARKMVERMAPQQIVEPDADSGELARMKMLSGFSEQAPDGPTDMDRSLDKLAPILIRLYDSGRTKADIMRLAGPIASKLGFSPTDPAFQQAFNASLNGESGTKMENQVSDQDDVRSLRRLAGM